MKKKKKGIIQVNTRQFRLFKTPLNWAVAQLGQNVKNKNKIYIISFTSDN